MATGIVIANRESGGGAGDVGFMDASIFAEKISTNILCEIVGGLTWTT